MRGHVAGAVATALVAVLVSGCGTPDRTEEFPKAGRPTAGKAADHPRTGDFNGDGRDDFAVLSGRRLTVVYGSAHGLDPRLRTVVPQPKPTYGSEQTRLFRADLDRDGFTDLLLSPESRPPTVLWGGPRGLAASAKSLKGPEKGPAAIGDFDGDGVTDLFVTGGETGPEGTVWYGPVDRNGVPDHRQELRYEHPADSVPAQVLAGDFDGDKATDLALWFVWTDPESEGDGDVTFTGQHRLRGGPKGLRLTERRRRPDLGLDGQPGDVDGDGIDDLYAAHFSASGLQFSAGYSLSTRSGAETGRKGGVSTAAPPGLVGGAQYGGMGETVLGDVTGDGRADLVTSATGANDSNGVVWMIPDVLRADAGDIRAVTLDTPGVPGSTTPSPGRGPTRHRITVLGPLLDTDGDGHLDVVFGSAGYLDAKKRDLDAFWVMRGTDRGMTYQRHFTAEDLR